MYYRANPEYEDEDVDVTIFSKKRYSDNVHVQALVESDEYGTAEVSFAFPKSTDWFDTNKNGVKYIVLKLKDQAFEEVFDSKDVVSDDDVVEGDSFSV